MTDWQSRAEHMRFDQGMSWAEIADELADCFPGLSPYQVREKIRDYIRRSKRYKDMRKADRRQSSIEYRSDGSIISDKFITLRDGADMTPELIIEAHGLNPSKWEVVAYRNNFWNTQIKGGEKQISYQSRLTVKPREYGIDYAEIDAHFDNLIREYKAPAVMMPRSRGDCMASVEIADLHFGRLCWHGNTGNNYDHRIARDMYLQIMSDVCAQLRGFGIEKILLPLGNDLVNSDNISRTTVAGTPQETDIRWEKMTNSITDTVIEGIDILKTIAPVHGLYVKSNHDATTTYGIVNTIRAWFRNDPDVTIDRDAISRKYMQYGVNLIGYCHGDKERPQKGTQERPSKLASLVPVEAPRMWADTTVREVHAAHWHTENVTEEINGVIVRRISSPTAPDTWTYEGGMVGNIRKAQTFVYDKHVGNIANINTPV